VSVAILANKRGLIRGIDFGLCDTGFGVENVENLDDELRCRKVETRK
jgi:hypothetical protein